MDFDGPAGPRGNRYVVLTPGIDADGAGEEAGVEQMAAHTAAGPLDRFHGAARRRQQSPSFTLESPTAMCVLSVEEGCVLAWHWDRDVCLLHNPTTALTSWSGGLLFLTAPMTHTRMTRGTVSLKSRSYTAPASDTE